jgi:ribose transport system permease protein
MISGPTAKAVAGGRRSIAGFEERWILLILLGMVAAFAFFSQPGTFFSFQNFQNIALDTSELLILSLGVTFLLVAGDIDLSIGSVVVFGSCVAAGFMATIAGSPDEIANGYPSLPLAIVVGAGAAILSGAAWGAINGLLVVKGRIPPFIATLGVMTSALGLAEVLTGGQNVAGVPRPIQQFFGLGKLAGVIPWPVVVAMVLTGLLWFVLSLSRFGLRTYAIGANAEAARRVGIGVARHRFVLYVLMGALAGLVAIIDVARFDTASVGSHINDPLLAISAVVIGGASLYGGRGSIFGTIIGAFIPNVMLNGFVILGIQPFWQNVAVGAVLVTAVYADQRRRRVSSS